MRKRIRGSNTGASNKLRLNALNEGLSLQIMHIGPYSEELRSIAKIDAFAQEQGYQLQGKHAEIYLSDPRRSAPEKLETVLRHPARRIGIGRVQPTGQIPPDVVRAVFRDVAVDAQKMRDLCVIEVMPQGQLVTYGMGVPLMRMRSSDQTQAQGRVAVS